MRLRRARRGDRRCRNLRLSVKYVIDRLYIKGDNGFCNGTRVKNFLMQFGTVESRFYPDTGVPIPNAFIQHLHRYSLERCDSLFGPEDIDRAEDALKDGPILGAFDYRDDFENLGPNEVYAGLGNGIAEVTSDDSGEAPEYVRHAVLIVGFTGRGKNGYWIVLNSWGKGLGKQRVWVDEERGNRLLHCAQDISW